MKYRYESLVALDTRGKEDTAKDMIERLEKEFAAEGAVIEQAQRLERREFSYPHDPRLRCEVRCVGRTLGH